MALETAAHTTPERAVACGIEAVGARLKRCEIADHRRERVLLAEDVVVERPLIVIGNTAVRLISEKTVGKFQQVIRTTILSVVATKVLTLCAWFEQMLLVADLARDEGVVVDKRIKQ